MFLGWTDRSKLGILLVFGLNNVETLSSVTSVAPVCNDL